jgi:hypothetical protein
MDPSLLASSIQKNQSLPTARQADLKAKKQRINWTVGNCAEVMQYAVKD